jgi:hypothetical protein
MTGVPAIPSARDLRLSTLALALAVAMGVAAGCSSGPSLLGGRERCWPSSEQRAASLWRGTLRIDAFGGNLDTPEGEVIPLSSGALRTRPGEAGTGELVSSTDEVVAKSGDDVTLFGGAGADGTLVVCAVEEVHARS